MILSEIRELTNKEFPNTTFKITRRNDTKQMLNFEIEGHYFEPEKILSSFSEKVWKEDKIPHDGELLNLTIDEIVI